MSRALATEHAGRISFDGIAASRGDSSAVELLVSVRRDDGAPATTMLLVSRAVRGEFERDLRHRLAVLVKTHAPGE